MTENRQGRFHASHVQTAPCERRVLQYSKIPLGQPERAYYLYKYIMDSDGMAVAKAHLICDKALA